MKYHNNRVKFSLRNIITVDGFYSLEYKHKINKVSFHLQDHKITNGQDPKNKIINGELYSDESSLNFSIGRKSSKEVAEWFSNKVSGSCTTFDHSPGELNFALFGDLRIEFANIKTSTKKTFYFSSIILAQGHAGAANNWWFGGNNCSNIGNKTVECTAHNILTLDEKYKFYFIRGGAFQKEKNKIEIRLANDFTWE